MSRELTPWHGCINDSLHPSKEPLVLLAPMAVEVAEPEQQNQALGKLM